MEKWFNFSFICIFKLLNESEQRLRMIAQSLWLFIIALQINVHIMKSLPQISRVMASWPLKAIPPSFSRSFSLPCSLALPFCHVCSGTYRVATGFLFSGNVLDERKATWSDLWGTTCRRLIFFSFPLLFFAVFFFMWPSSWGAGWAGGFRRIVDMGLSLSFLLVWLPTPSCVFCMSLFSEAEEFWARVTPREVAWQLLRESVRDLKRYGRSGGWGK